jgi:hypothetical protein
MRTPKYVVYLAVLLAAGVSLAADAPNVASKASTAAGTSAPQTTQPQSPRDRCVRQCEQNNGMCNSDVRRNKQDCEKQAANRGNNPFTGRPDAYDGYCGYFHSYGQCGYFSNRGGCTSRYARRYAECVEWMRGNIASQRFDCYKAESKASGLCRAELRDCRVQCD